MHKINFCLNFKIQAKLHLKIGETFYRKFLIKIIQLDVTRFDIEPTSVLYKESGDYFRSLYEGQVKIKGKKYYLDVSSFRTNNIQSYIFRESNKIPTFLDAYDLDNEYIYMK